MANNVFAVIEGQRTYLVPHLEVSRRRVENYGDPPHTATLCATACGAEIATTLVTSRPEGVRCPFCKAGETR